jgi:Rieske Fe-S protein
MPDWSKPRLWREEFSVFAADERYVNRRQFAKFLTLTSAAMFAGNLWILMKAWLRGAEPVFPQQPIAKVGEIPVGEVKLFANPVSGDQSVLIRLGEDRYAAFSQKCTHLSCAVYYERASNQLVCPCHEGRFSAEDGRVLAGPPMRPLPRVLLERRGADLVAIGVGNGGG